MYKLLLNLIVIFYIGLSFATATDNIEQSNISLKNSTFGIPANSPVTEKLLDSCWLNRENAKNQIIIELIFSRRSSKTYNSS